MSAPRRVRGLILTLVAVVVPLVTAFTTRTAHAEVSDVDKAMAQILFEEGRSLVEKGDVDAACDRFERSQKLDAANGTLLNLAHCYERAGRVATAWLMFHDALGAAMRDGRPDRETFARDHIVALQGRLPRIVIRGEPCSSCEVQLDGRRIDRAVVGVLTPVDPGEHRLVVRLRSGQQSAVTVATVREGEAVMMELPDAPAETASGAVVPRSHARRNLGVVSLGTSAAALGMGFYFGARALSLSADANAACPTSACADANAVDVSRQADRSAWVANIALGTAVVAGGIGAYLLITSREPKAGAQRAMLGRITF